MVRRVVRAWRDLTDDPPRRPDLARRTLIACSGGGDSSGLALALGTGIARPGEVLVLAYVGHDLRPEVEVHADLEAVQALGARLGVPVVSTHIAVRRRGGNVEGEARRARYAALRRLAEECACPFVATAHHAQDQLESVLMALIRGSGPGGMSGTAPRRRLSQRVVLIRPCLELRREDLHQVCIDAGWTWREDATNGDAARLRAALRLRVIPELERLRPGASLRAARGTRLVAEAAALVRQRARRLVRAGRPSGGTLTWDRQRLRCQPAIVLGEWLRMAGSSLQRGQGRDRMPASALRRIVLSVRDREGGLRRFVLSGVEVIVSRDQVRVCRRDG